MLGVFSDEDFLKAKHMQPRFFYRAFDRLLDRLAQGGVVPFLGAGISTGAEAPEGFEPTLQWMKQRVKAALEPELRDQENPRVNLRHVRDQLKREKPQQPCTRGSCKLADSEGSNFRWKRDDSELKFDQLAENFTWLHGDDGEALLCSILKIQAFAELKPTRAHRYLACLAREELIREVLTTNYDLCVERAYEATFGASRDAGEQNARQAGNKTPVVIATLREYRQYGGVRWSDDGHHRPVLHVYKLNGCARTYADTVPSDPRKAAAGILLTERQLQSHDNHPWKKDLLRDRLRSFNLLLSGFGSEEPQVRYLALEIQREFAGDAETRNSNSNLSAMLQRTDTPFIAAYSSLEFAHVQILEGYYGAHGYSFIHSLERESNAFTGEDAGFLSEEESDGGKLAADLFWERLFQGAYKRLLIKTYLARGERFHNWLQSHTDHPCAWIGFMLRCLYPPCKQKASPCDQACTPDKRYLGCGDQRPEHISELDCRFGGFRRLLTIPSGIPNDPMPLMRIFRQLLPLGEFEGNETQWYLPLREKPIALPALFLLLCLVGRAAVDKLLDSLGDCEDNPDNGRPRGLLLSLPFGRACPSSSIKLRVCHRSLGGEKVPLRHDTGSRLLYRIMLPRMNWQPVEQRWFFVEHPSINGNLGRIRFGREFSICFAAVIQGMRNPDNGQEDAERDPQDRVRKELIRSLKKSFNESRNLSIGRKRLVRLRGPVISNVSA
ncbi:MAG: SIR2 family protein [Thiotrichales bacterium]